MNSTKTLKWVFIYSLILNLGNVTESTGPFSLQGSNQDKHSDSSATSNEQGLVLPSSGAPLETILEEDEEEATIPEPLIDPPKLDEDDGYFKFNGNILVELDLNIKESTDCFIFREDRPTKHRFYQCKKGYLFGAVKDSIYDSELELPGKPLILDKSHPDFNEILKRSKSISGLSDGRSVSTTSVRSYNMANLSSLEVNEPVSFNEDESPLDPFFTTLELDNKETTHYIEYAFDDSDNTHVFGPSDPFIIKTITKGGEPIWTYDDDANDGKFPFSIEFNGTDKVEVGFEEFYLTYTLNDQGNWAVKRHLYEEAEEGQASVEKLDDNLETRAGEDENKLNEEFDISALELIWSFKLDTLSTSKGVYPNYVAVGPESKRKMVTIFFTDRSMRRFIRLGRFGPWKEWVLPSTKKTNAA